MPHKTLNPTGTIHNTLFHCTLAMNRYLVANQGILVSKDARHKGRIWLTTATHVDHVARHLTALRGLSVANWSVFAVRCDLLPQFPLFSGRKGVFFTKQDISPMHIELAFNLWVGFEPHDNEEYAAGEYVYTRNGCFRPAADAC